MNIAKIRQNPVVNASSVEMIVPHKDDMTLGMQQCIYPFRGYMSIVLLINNMFFLKMKIFKNNHEFIL